MPLDTGLTGIQDYSAGATAQGDLRNRPWADTYNVAWPVTASEQILSGGQPAAPREPGIAFTHCITLKPIGVAALWVAVPAIGCIVVGLVFILIEGPGGGSGG